jgi:hypothetical protein
MPPRRSCCPPCLARDTAQQGPRLHKLARTRQWGKAPDIAPATYLDPADAGDILLTLAGPATYRSLVADYGWPHDRFVDWLAATLSQQLLPASRAAPS